MIIIGKSLSGKTSFRIEALGTTIHLYINGVRLVTEMDEPEAARELVLRLAGDLGIWISAEAGE